MERKNVTVILRMANACNLSCSYCYDKDNRMDTNKINEKFMENIDKIVNYVKSFDFNDNRNFNLILHGGEPLILSDEVYIAFLEKITNSIKKITISIQTNGTLLTQQKLKILDKYGVHIGISLDGSNEIQNKNRIFKNGKNSFNEVKKVIDMLNNNHSRFGIIMTLSKNNINTEQEIYDFIRENNLNCNIRPAFPTKKTEENNIIMNSNEYITFFKRLFDVWYNDNTNSIKLKQITEVYEEFLKILEPNMYRGTCENSMNCFGNFVGLDTYGNVYTCNRTYNEKEFFLGNLNQISAEEIIDKCKKFCLDRKKSIEESKCKECEIFKFCYGGCPANSYYLYNDYTKPFLYNCKVKKAIFYYIKEKMDSEGQIIEYNKRKKKRIIKK